MKKITRSVLLTVIITLTVLTGITAGTAMLLIPAVIGTPETPAGEELSGIEYSATPENQTLFIVDEQDRGALLYLGFSEIVTHVYLFADSARERVAELPYEITYTVRVGEDFLGKLCDRLGGIDIAENGKTERYFSASLEEFYGKKPDYEKLYKISGSFFEKIANMGLSSEDFMFIIEISDTDLTYSVCYGWIDRLPELFCNCIFH